MDGKIHIITPDGYHGKVSESRTNSYASRQPISRYRSRIVVIQRGFQDHYESGISTDAHDPPPLYKSKMFIGFKASQAHIALHNHPNPNKESQRQAFISSPSQLPSVSPSPSQTRFSVEQIRFSISIASSISSSCPFLRSQSHARILLPISVDSAVSILVARWGLCVMQDAVKD